MLKPFEIAEYELIRELKEDGITITNQEIQKVRENDAETLYIIGDRYSKKGNDRKSLPWFQKAASQDHTEAQARVGRMYLDGKGTPQNFKLAMDWSMKGASSGNADCQYILGDLYYFGRGVLRDYNQGMNWYMKAANNRNTDAQCQIGFLYCWGEGVSKDYEQAMDWFFEAAKNGNIEAMNEIGWMYNCGKGVTKDIPAAIAWFKKAVNQGDKHAQYMLGLIYKNEEGYKDLQKAVNWYQKAIANGYWWAKHDVKKLNELGYYADEEVKGILITSAMKDTKHLTTVKIEHETIMSVGATNSISNDQQINNLIDNKMKAMEKVFQSKIHLIEENVNNLKQEVAALKQEKCEQCDEIKRLRGETKQEGKKE